MDRYFLHLRNGTEELLDADGIVFRNLDVMRKAVMVAVRDLIQADVERGVIDMRFRIDAETEPGKVIYSLPFKHAVRIIPEAATLSAGANYA